MTFPEQLFADLRIDCVLPLGAIRRRYGAVVGTMVMQLATERALVVWVEWVALTARSRTIWPITFVATKPFSGAAATLRHMAGVAEMRWQLHDTVNRWEASGEALLHGSEQPDALADDWDGCLAVEYDAGAYSADQVRRKARTYQAVFGRQIWGVPYDARQRWLRPHLPPQTKVLLAPWW